MSGINSVSVGECLKTCCYSSFRHFNMLREHLPTYSAINYSFTPRFLYNSFFKKNHFNQISSIEIQLEETTNNGFCGPDIQHLKVIVLQILNKKTNLASYYTKVHNINTYLHQVIVQIFRPLLTSFVVPTSNQLMKNENQG